MQNIFMNEAVELSRQNLTTNEGGPFGAIVVRNGEVIGKGANKVTSTNDPTAHAEIVAIRDACKNINSFSLSGCELYTSCEPCPMCLAAIYWARIEKLYYANTRYDAAEIGFDDSYIYDQINLDSDKRDLKIVKLESLEAKRVFQDWLKKSDKTEY